MPRSYLIDFYQRKLALSRAELAALPKGAKGSKPISTEILDLEARMARALAQADDL
jgi:hypothetical protein